MSATDSNMRDTLQALYSDHHGWLLGWLRRKLGCRLDAADLTHDTFVRILTAPKTPEFREPRAYLVTTARRLLIDRTRRKTLEQAYLEVLANPVHALPSAPAPEEVLTALQVLEQISRALDSLAPKVREAFLLHYIEGHAQAMIAERLGVSVRMVQKYLMQALLECQRVEVHGL